MNTAEQFAKLEVLIEKAEYWYFEGLNQEIADFRDEQDVVVCEEGEDCICQRFDLARDAVDDENSSEAVRFLKQARSEFVEATKEKIKSLESELEDQDLEHATRQGTIEVIERLEAIIEDIDE